MANFETIRLEKGLYSGGSFTKAALYFSPNTFQEQ